jgi:hypothetical protein
MRVFDISKIDVERLLEQWRWLCPQRVALLARNCFGDLFLGAEDGQVLWLDVTSAVLHRIASSESEFDELLMQPTNRNAWLAEDELQSCEGRGLAPDDFQCIGFKTPLVFAESAATPDNAFVADLYEHVSFLGELHRQIANEPDGAKVRLRVNPT